MPDPGDGRTAAAVTHPRGARAGEFLAGDGIRGIGMVCIIMAHLVGGALAVQGVFYKGFRGGYGTVPGVLFSGLQLGLPMFFVLSGYLISRPWVRAYVLGRPIPKLGRYVRARVFRIVPVFWLIGVLMFIQYGWHGASLLDVVRIFGFAQIYHAQTPASGFIGQAWSIDVEVAFYVIVPVSAWLLTIATRRALARSRRELAQRERVAIVVGLVALATGASAYLRGTTVGSLWNESLPATFYYFAPGVALAALELEFTGTSARARLRRLAPVLGLGATAIALGLAYAESHDPNALIKARGALAVAVGSGLALGALLARQLATGASPRWVDNPVTRWLGARSYPSYLLQSATIASAVLIVGRVGGGPWVQLLAMTAFVLPITVALGAVVHVTIERPLLEYGHGRSRRAVVPRAGATADPVTLDQRLLVASRPESP